jgi:hypothetical protein
MMDAGSKPLHYTSHGVKSMGAIEKLIAPIFKL